LYVVVCHNVIKRVALCCSDAVVHNYPPPLYNDWCDFSKDSMLLCAAVGCIVLHAVFCNALQYVAVVHNRLACFAITGAISQNQLVRDLQYCTSHTDCIHNNNAVCLSHTFCMSFSHSVHCVNDPVSYTINCISRTQCVSLTHIS